MSRFDVKTFGCIGHHVDFGLSFWKFGVLVTPCVFRVNDHRFVGDQVWSSVF